MTDKFLAIDPGGTSGYAIFSEEGAPTGFGKIKGHDKFLDWLETQTPKMIIMEDYKIRPGVPHNFSSVPTIQLIGAIKRYASKGKITVVLQQPPDLYIGLRFLGLYDKYKGMHVPDDVSALAHGTFYMVKNNIAKHRLDRT